MAALLVSSCAATREQPEFQRIHELQPDEGVFAYSRISPDGRILAYASELPDPEKGGQISQTIKLVNLEDGRILFQEPGIDAYWSNDGTRMIYLKHPERIVTIRHHPGGQLARNVVQDGLGDYFSWAVHDGRDLILTIQGNYYYLDGDTAVFPIASVQPCPGVGTGQRPLISHDGMRISAFARGTVIVRGLTDCEDILDTGIGGAKADFSFDGRYIAMHRARQAHRSYEIVVVDLQQKSYRVVTDGLPGSSTFPSWTRDGRLNFRYESPDFRGFLLASRVLSAAAHPLPVGRNHLANHRSWNDILPESERPPQSLNLVTIWGTWSAHSPQALVDLQRARDYFEAQSTDVSVNTALEPGTSRADADRILRQNRIQLPELPLSPQGFAQTEARNQIPSTLLFRDGKLVDRRLGPLSFEGLKEWIGAMQGTGG